MLDKEVIIVNDAERIEFENYLTNRFIRQEHVENYECEIITQWQEWLQNYDVHEILNDIICSKRPVKFASPESIMIKIHEAAAGKVPIIIFGDDMDFENFIVNLIYKGIRPDNISQMGASFIYGKKQRFLALSKKYYSNTPPEYVGLSSEEWREKSMIIRCEHECTHYYTKKFYGSASNNLHDELIADFFGLYNAFGYYDANLFQHFMGIDGTHDGRLSLYTVGLSPAVVEAIAETARKCSDILEEWAKSDSFKRLNTDERISYLCETSLTEMIYSSHFKVVFPRN